MSSVKICILDYGSGNVKSVYNIVSYLKCDVVISNSPDEIRDATHFILPGVGSFGPAMVRIRNTIPLEILEKEVFENKKPFLGICVGMQILAEKGFEHGENQGLGWIKGSVVRLEANGLPLPHIGWNDVDIKKESLLFKGFANIRDFYFVHSFAFAVKDKELILTETEYGNNFCSSVQLDNIYGVQFHPEKSQKAGQLLLKNFFEYHEKK
jgi:glutamine amidotransferase